MKRIIISTTVIAILAGFMGMARSQTDSSDSSDSIPHKVGLIDMARVFKEYDKFGALREDLKAEITQSDQQAKAMAAQIQKVAEEMKEYNPDNQAFVDLEKQQAKLTAEFNGFRGAERQKFMRREAQIYKTIYLEAVDVVKRYAEHFHYTLIIRFNGAKLDSADPKTLIQSLNRQVVYHRFEDDITGSVIEFLNRNYTPERSSSTPREANPRQSGKRTTVK